MATYLIPQDSDRTANEFIAAMLGLNGGIYPRYVRYDGMVWCKTTGGYASTDATAVATMTDDRALKLIADRRAEAVNAEVMAQ